MRFFNSRKRIVVSMLVAGLILLSGLIIWYELSYSGKFYPRTIVAGENVSGKTYQEVFDALLATAERFEREGLMVQIASSSIKVPAFSQGLSPDTVIQYFIIGNWQKELDAVYRRGRHGALFERIGEQLEAAFSGVEAQFPYVFQEDAVRSLLARELAGVLKKRTEAAFRIVGSSVEIVPEVTGEAVDQNAVIIELKYRLARLTANSISIPVSLDFPVVTAKRLATLSDFASLLVRQSSVFLNVDGFSGYISGLKLASWLTLKNEPGISIAIDRDKLEAYVHASVDPYVTDAPRNARFEVRDGVLVEITSGLPGQAVDIDSFYNQLTEAVAAMYLKSAFGDLPVAAVVPIKLTVGLIAESPRVTKETISAYGIKDLVGTITTSFKGSTADRIQNIKTGLSKINGLLIAPGQEFSAVEAIGYVTAEEGYVEEYVIKGNESVKEFGGGLCQIATTLFRLALNAGMPITERQNHRYVVSYYGPGLDATIYGPHPDFRFVNDTQGYLLLQGRISGTSLILDLYGKKDGRTASVTEPVITERIPPPPPKYIPSYELPLGEQKCTEQARYGMTTDATYAVTYPNGQSKTQNFHSVYQPWAKVCLVGIATSAPTAPDFFAGVH